MIDLYLTINPGGHKMMRMRNREKAFLPIRKMVLQRDKSICQFCEFEGLPKQMQVVNLDGDYNNNKSSNLVTACSICTRCMLLGSFETSGEHDSVERLIICNELSQVQLNHLYRVLLTSMSDSSLEQHETAKSIFRSLRNRAGLVDEMFGKNASDTRVFVQSVLDSGVGGHRNLRYILQNLRYFPSRNSFHNEWALWKNYLNQNISTDLMLHF